MDAKDLARQALGVLDLQQQYFRNPNPTRLAECRDAERRLRAACNDVLRGHKQGNLLDGQQ
jgi:hypothetical protein